MSSPRIAGILLALLALGCAGARPPASGARGGADLPDLAIRNVAVLDVEAKTLLSNQEIVVRGGRIAAVHPQPDPPTPARRSLDGSALLALPGFVDTHTHLWQHVARGLYPGGTLQTWVRIYGLAHSFTPEELRQVTTAAASQALLSGITTVADFTSVNFSDFAVESTCRAFHEAGMGGAVIWWNPAAFLPAAVKEAEIRRLQKLCAPAELWMGPGPLSFFSVPEVYDGIRLAQRLSLRLTEHTMENVQEQADFHKRLNDYLGQYRDRLRPEDLAVLAPLARQSPPPKAPGLAQVRRLAALLLERGGPLAPEEAEELRRLSQPETISPVPLLQHLGALPGFLSIHSTWQSRRDLDAYVASRVTVSHNPESNLYLSSGIAPVLDYLDRGIVVSLGTDGAASNDGIDFFSAMRLLWNLQKVSLLAPEAVNRQIDAWQVLRIATLNGALALGQQDRIGSLRPGKEADVVLLSRERLGMSPLFNADQAAALVVYSGGVRDVDTVISDGQVVVERGRLTRFEERALAQALDRTARALEERRTNGKTWTETFEPACAPRTYPWFRYRSVRLKDLLALRLRNRCPESLRVTVATSGQTFGGVAAPMLLDEARQRFPLRPPESFWSRSFTLRPGQELRLDKPPGGMTYTVAAPDGPTEHSGAKAGEQILLLVETSPPS
ncbi:MAG: amidohydrolase family protein [Thermoanaerobaculia bacterium]